VPESASQLLSARKSLVIRADTGPRTHLTQKAERTAGPGPTPEGGPRTPTPTMRRWLTGGQAAPQDDHEDCSLLIRHVTMLLIQLAERHNAVA